MSKVTAAGGGLILVVFVLIAFAVGGGSNDCDTGTGDVGELSATAKNEIPKKAAELYYAVAKKENIDVAFLASIGAQECDHGRCAGLKMINAAGCVGWMQLGVGGRCGHFWDANKCDGDGDGKMNVLDAADNICASAKGLRHEKGAPPAGGSEAGYHKAACGYYGACSDGVADYANEVMARAKTYGFKGGTKTTELVSVSDTNSTGATGQCGSSDTAGSLADGTDGKVVFPPNANRPGAPVTNDLKLVLRKLAGYYGHPITVCTGTNHKRLSASGLVSDHWEGNGADICGSGNGFPDDGAKGDLIAAAAFRVAGQSEEQAIASGKRGGLQNVVSGGFRFQIIWKTNEGGNHHNHVHVGVKRVGATQQAVADTHEFRLPT